MFLTIHALLTVQVPSARLQAAHASGYAFLKPLISYRSLQRIHWQLFHLVDFEHHQLQVPGAPGGPSPPVVQPVPASKLLLAPPGLVTFPYYVIALFPYSVLEVPLHVVPVCLH